MNHDSSLGGLPFQRNGQRRGVDFAGTEREEGGSWAGRHLAKSPLFLPFPPCQRTAGAASGVAGCVLLSRGCRTRAPNKLSLAYLGQKARRERFNVGPADTLYSSLLSIAMSVVRQEVATLLNKALQLLLLVALAWTLFLLHSILSTLFFFLFFDIVVVVSS